MNPGDSFHLENHLWFVLSDPNADPDRVVIVNLTTWAAYHDQNCILYEGDHRFVKHRTCVLYRKARVVSLKELEEWCAARWIASDEPAKPEILKQMRAGAIQCHLTPIGVTDVLTDQSLV